MPERVSDTKPNTTAPTCRWCGRDIERISAGRWANGKPMYRHVDTTQPPCYRYGVMSELAEPIEPQEGDDD